MIEDYRENVFFREATESFSTDMGRQEAAKRTADLESASEIGGQLSYVRLPWVVENLVAKFCDHCWRAINSLP